jgi:hypothetical protein
LAVSGRVFVDVLVAVSGRVLVDVLVAVSGRILVDVLLAVSGRVLVDVLVAVSGRILVDVLLAVSGPVLVALTVNFQFSCGSEEINSEMLPLCPRQTAVVCGGNVIPQGASVHMHPYKETWNWNIHACQSLQTGVRIVNS